jgi:1-deoxy-D-xylulose-5-phosphate reductoisomerase
MGNAGTNGQIPVHAYRQVVMKKIVILGATGSIGTQTVDVVRRLPDRLRIVGISAYRNFEPLRQLASEFDLSPERTQCGDGADLESLARIDEADLVVVAVAGAAGIRATAAALECGKDVALATKEVLVAAGEPITAIAKRTGARILPIDSEHSAVFQCLEGSHPSRAHVGEKPRDVARIMLTASGGPFRQWPKDRILSATLEDALAHPTWPSMGRKITIDSATMMNKGLEVIEARWLFDMPVDKIDVVVHPQSVVHSMIEFVDGSILAQLGLPDMRVPIQYALTFPDRIDTALPRLDISRLSTPLTFEPPDEDRFPCLRLAREAAAAAGTAPAVLNAANEAAVALFLDKNIGFSDIPVIVEQAVTGYGHMKKPTLDHILTADSWARAFVSEIAAQGTSKVGNNATETSTVSAVNSPLPHGGGNEGSAS